MTRAEKIAWLNDRFRCQGIDIQLTQGILHNVYDHAALVERVQAFDTFTEDIDPYGEHDFGALNWYGRKIFWKIDYCDRTLTYGVDPLDPDCRRLLTVMLASEY